MASVSIIIPAYNAVRWLPETLQSVADQGQPDAEVIIVDDGSTDSTAAYLSKEWPQHQLIRTENQGVSHARNLGLSQATGDVIQFLDADDLLMPGKIASGLQMLAAQPGLDIVYTNWKRYAERADGQFERGELVERKYQDIAQDPELAFFSTMWCPTGAYLYRRSFLEKAGEWKVWLPVVQDARFAWDCARAGARWGHDPRIGVLYRQHRSGSVSTRSRKAFLKDCWANTLDIERIWSSDGRLTGERRQMIVQSCSSLARGFYEFDKSTFEEVYAHLLSLKPDFRPQGNALPFLSSLFGYRNAEGLALCFRRLKRLFTQP